MVLIQTITDYATTLLLKLKDIEKDKRSEFNDKDEWVVELLKLTNS